MTKLSFALMPVIIELKKLKYVLIPLFMLTTWPVSLIQNRFDSIASGLK